MTETMSPVAETPIRCRRTGCVDGLVTLPPVCGHSGNCPCATIEAPCEECRGTGTERCAWCGDAPATARLDDDDLCDACAAEAAA